MRNKHIYTHYLAHSVIPCHTHSTYLSNSISYSLRLTLSHYLFHTIRLFSSVHIFKYIIEDWNDVIFIKKNYQTFIASLYYSIILEIESKFKIAIYLKLLLATFEILRADKIRFEIRKYKRSIIFTKTFSISLKLECLKIFNNIFVINTYN